jgi:predicted RNA binding protein with dsRBD fold (UPF0201 family)
VETKTETLIQQYIYDTAEEVLGSKPGGERKYLFYINVQTGLVAHPANS